MKKTILILACLLLIYSPATAGIGNPFGPIQGVGGGSANGFGLAGTISASGDATNFPSANAGEWYQVSSSGWLGGGVGVGRYVVNGQLLYCWHTANAGTEAAVGGYWFDGPKIISMPDGYRTVDMANDTVETHIPTNGFRWLNNEFIVYENSVSRKEYHGGVIDGGGSPIAQNKKVYIRIPRACTIVGTYIMADRSGTISVDVWKHAWGTMPLVTDKISASVPIALSGAQMLENATLTGWTTSVAAGDIVCLNVSALATSITWVSIGLILQ